MQLFWHANNVFLSIIGLWVKMRPEHNFIGMHIAVDDDPELDCKVTAIDKQSLHILQETVLVKPSSQMQTTGYPDCLSIVIDMAGFRMVFAKDLALNGRLLAAESPLFDVRSLHKFIVPVGAAARGEQRRRWKKNVRITYIPRPWQDFKDWQTKLLAAQV